MKGKGRVDEVWDPDMFGEWCGSVFKVGRLGMVEEREDEDDGGSDFSRSGSV